LDLKTARHALITGGASGVGLALAKAFSSRGISVTIVDANQNTLSAALAMGLANFRGFCLDVRDRSGWLEVKATAETAFGPVDILMNNAGIAPSGDEIADMDAAHFDQILAINLTGVFNGISAFAKDMRARRGGHIVNTASMAGISIMPSTGAYVASKFGVVGLSETLRAELAPFGVGVSTFCPGQMATSLIDNTVAIGGVTKFPSGPIAGGADPDALAPLILRGIEANAEYILTDPEVWRPRVHERLVNLSSAFANDTIAK
jgi:NAD(P)-dependent dehydrogenase (short-subunit alcohol dehydrogenase family)